MTLSNPNKPSVARHQRGAIGVLAALVLTLLMVCVTLVLDVGRLMMEKRRLQQNADLAAMAAAQQYCDGAAGVSQAEAIVRTTLADNGFDPDNNQNGVSVALGTVAVSQGNPPLRVFTADANGQAIRVRLSKTVPAAIFAGGGPITLQTQATAQRNLIGVLSAGSKLANVNTADATLLNPLLGSMLGVPLAITAVGYNGLVQANIELKKLRDAMISAGVLPTGASVQDIAGKTPSLGTLLSVMASAANGTPAASTLLNIKAAMSGASATQPVNLGSILAIDHTLNPNEGQSGSINGMALLMASAMAVNAGKVLNIGLNVGSNGLTSLLGSTLNTTLSLGVIAPPTIAIGRFGQNRNGDQYTLAKTSQVNVTLKLNLDLPPKNGGLLGAILSAVASVKADIGLQVNAAGGRAWLEEIVECPSRQSPQFRFALGVQPEAASLKLGSSINPDLPANLDIKAVLGLAQVTSQLRLDLPIGNASPTVIPYSVDISNANALPTPSVTVPTNLASSLNQGLNTAIAQISANARIIGIDLGIDLSQVISEVLNLLTPILTQIASDVLQPVLALLGVQLGTVDVSLLAVEPGQGALLL